MMDINLFVNILLLSCCYDVSNAKSKLLTVVQIFRHGERTPLVFYPTDPYQDPKYWNGLGPGKLTENGKQQLYDLGKYFKNRYDSFIASDYIGADISVYSSNTDRNIDSAKYFLNGMYGNVEIPIEVAKKPILSSLIECLKINIEYLKSEAQNEEFIEINKNNRELYDYLNKHTEMPIFGLTTAFLIWDTLNIEKKVNLQTPQWTEKVWATTMMQLSKNFSRIVCQQESIQKLATGAFLDGLIEHFEKIVKGSDAPKTILYSGHDINLMCFLSVFDYYKYAEPESPPFGSSIIFELRQEEESNNYFVNTFYKSSIEDTEIALMVKGCDPDCPFENFKNVLADLRITPEDWYQACYYLD